MGGENKRPPIYKNGLGKFNFFIPEIYTSNNCNNNNYFGTGMVGTPKQEK